MKGTTNSEIRTGVSRQSVMGNVAEGKDKIGRLKGPQAGKNRQGAKKTGVRKGAGGGGRERDRFNYQKKPLKKKDRKGEPGETNWT